ncbi:PA2778 family cysteine peptidase [Alkalilimnicola sp. S0819]|uniref:PA2778 family cysteine peptidase n=1 Tax=Alkalilimnicola sp. S0819 TaxID=2613922 RepID=UPI00126299DE|nr:PA2778 family cysteine peptidase [Alkalilimnicola sp. S0819]KAB7623722.1 PA2778 family cysteine peptidase [Alkalilimnicola sp. S0819]MPQ16851.1 PA2778 family cysteine peptidase [Alkalilimnicola sp. S0819]
MAMWALLAGLLGGCAVAPPSPNMPAAGTPITLHNVPLHPQRSDHCGPAALAMMLGWSGLSLSPDDLAADLFIPQRAGTLQTELIAQTRARARLPWRLSGGFETLLGELRAGRPVLVMQNLALPWWPRWHYAVVVGYRPARATVILHGGGEHPQAMPLRRFLRSWERAEHWAMLTLPPGQVPTGAEALAYLRAAYALETTQGAANALPYYHTARRHWPYSAEAHLSLANAWHQAGDSKRAIAVLQDALAGGLRDARIEHNLRWLRQHDGAGQG